MKNPFKHIEKTLKKTQLTMRAFSSGGRVRVLRMDSEDEKQKYYGEGGDLYEALQRMESDCKAGDNRDYKKVYMFGGYLTGSISNGATLDSFVAFGNTFKVRYDEREEKFEIIIDYTEHYKIPDWIVTKVKTEGKPVVFQNDNGNTYRSYAEQYHGGIGVATECLEKVTEDAWMIPKKYKLFSNSLTDLFQRAEGAMQILFIEKDHRLEVTA